MWLLDFCFALRPLVLVPAWSFFLLGYGAGRPAGAVLYFPAASFVCFTLVMAGVHLVNQVVDLESDRLNAKGFFLQRGVFSSRQYIVVATCMLAAGTGVAAALRASPWLLLAAAALGLAYSVRPLHLAARPGLDLAANALGYGGVALWLGAGAARAAAPGWPLTASAMLAVAAVFLHTTLLDVEGDRRTGKRTIGIACGASRARWAAAALAGAAAVCAGAAGWKVALAAALALAAATFGAASCPRRITSRTVCVGATATYAVAAGIVWPPFLPAVAMLAVVTRFYYRSRFGVRYPAL